jgi:hypothetical protein
MTLPVGTMTSPHLAFKGTGCSFWVGCHLMTCRLTDQNLPICGERDVTGKCLATNTHIFRAWDDDRPTSAQHRSRRVCCAKINTDNRHQFPFLSLIAQARAR